MSKKSPPASPQLLKLNLPIASSAANSAYENPSYQDLDSRMKTIPNTTNQKNPTSATKPGTANTNNKSRATSKEGTKPTTQAKSAKKQRTPSISQNTSPVKEAAKKSQAPQDQTTTPKSVGKKNSVLVTEPEVPKADAEPTPEEARERLFKVFQYYTSIVEHGNVVYLKAHRFSKMMIDSEIRSEELNQSSLDLLYAGELRRSGNLDFEKFLKLLARIAKVKFGQLSIDAAQNMTINENTQNTPDSKETWNRILKEHMFPLYVKIFEGACAPDDDSLSQVSIERNTNQVLGMVSNNLEDVYKKYFPFEIQSISDPNARRQKMENALFTFLRDLSICPDLVSKGNAYAMWQDVMRATEGEAGAGDKTNLLDANTSKISTKSKVGGKGGKKAVPFTFDQFKNYIVRVASQGYKDYDSQAPLTSNRSQALGGATPMGMGFFHQSFSLAGTPAHGQAMGGFGPLSQQVSQFGTPMHQMSVMGTPMHQMSVMGTPAHGAQNGQFGTPANRQNQVSRFLQGKGGNQKANPNISVNNAAAWNAQQRMNSSINQGGMNGQRLNSSINQGARGSTFVNANTNMTYASNAGPGASGAGLQRTWSQNSGFFTQGGMGAGSVLNQSLAGNDYKISQTEKTVLLLERMDTALRVLNPEKKGTATVGGGKSNMLITQDAMTKISNYLVLGEDGNGLDAHVKQQQVNVNSGTNYGRYGIIDEEVVKLFEKYGQNLNKVFQYYASYSQPLNSTRLSAFKFHKLLRESGLSQALTDANGNVTSFSILHQVPLTPQSAGKSIASTDADIIIASLTGPKQINEVNREKITFNPNVATPFIGSYTSLYKSSPLDFAIQNRLEYEAFLKALEMVAAKLYPDLALVKAVNRILEKNILKLEKEIDQIQKDQGSKPLKVLVDLLQDPELVEFLAVTHKAIMLYYRFYADPKGMMNIEKFMQFCKDFEIFPSLISKSRLCNLFRALCGVRAQAQESDAILNLLDEGNSSEKKSDKPKDDEGMIDEHMFVEALAVCAVDIPYLNPQPSDVIKVFNFLEKINHSKGPSIVRKELGNTRAVGGVSWDIMYEIRNKYPEFFIEEEEPLNDEEAEKLIQEKLNSPEKVKVGK